MASPLKAVVFDSDGTLLNSFEMIVAAYAHVGGKFGYEPPTPEAVRVQLGRALPLHEIYQNLFPGADIEAMIRENGLFIAKNAGTSAAFDGLVEMLQTLKDAGLMLAIVTGGNHKIHDLLAHHEIGDYFVSVVHSEQVSRAKPDPEGVLKALDEMGVMPREAVMIGDSPNDIFAGKNAHVAATIGITHGYGERADLVAANADYIVDSLEELTATIQKLAS